MCHIYFKKKFSKLGIKDFAIQDFYNSRPFKVNLPNGIYGPRNVDVSTYQILDIILKCIVSKDIRKGQESKVGALFGLQIRFFMWVETKFGQNSVSLWFA